jgi:NDP-sugar pyrophosphorylase family protein
MSDRFFALSIAGGRGERLRPLTDCRPKPMVELDGKPLLAYQVEWMRSQGITDVIFLTGYKGEKIQDYFGNGVDHGITAHYSPEESPLGRGGAIKQGMSLVPQAAKHVLVANGDVITNQPLDPLMKLHNESRAVGTMMLVPFPSQYGVVEVDATNSVTRFVEKGSLPFWINAGVYLFDRHIESILPDVGDHETTTFQELTANGKLAALRSESFWASIESPKDITDIAGQIRSGKINFNQ